MACTGWPPDWEIRENLKYSGKCDFQEINKIKYFFKQFYRGLI